MEQATRQSAEQHALAEADGLAHRPRAKRPA